MNKLPSHIADFIATAQPDHIWIVAAEYIEAARAARPDLQIEPGTIDVVDVDGSEPEIVVYSEVK